MAANYSAETGGFPSRRGDGAIDESNERSRRSFRSGMVHEFLIVHKAGTLSHTHRAPTLACVRAPPCRSAPSLRRAIPKEPISTTGLLKSCYPVEHVLCKLKSWHRSNVVRAARRVAEPIGRASTRGGR
jgi:hypothetical protein